MHSDLPQKVLAYPYYPDMIINITFSDSKYFSLNDKLYYQPSFYSCTL